LKKTINKGKAKPLPKKKFVLSDSRLIALKKRLRLKGKFVTREQAVAILTHKLECDTSCMSDEEI